MAEKKVKAPMKILVVDIGGTNVKILASGASEPRRFPSGKKLTPGALVSGVKKAAEGWTWDVVEKLPEGCRAGNNGNAFAGGFRLWEKPR